MKIYLILQEEIEENGEEIVSYDPIIFLAREKAIEYFEKCEKEYFQELLNHFDKSGHYMTEKVFSKSDTIFLCWDADSQFHRSVKLIERENEEGD